MDMILPIVILAARQYATSLGQFLPSPLPPLPFLIAAAAPVYPFVVAPPAVPIFPPSMVPFIAQPISVNVTPVEISEVVAPISSPHNTLHSINRLNATNNAFDTAIASAADRARIPGATAKAQKAQTYRQYPGLNAGIGALGLQGTVANNALLGLPGTIPGLTSLTGALPLPGVIPGLPGLPGLPPFIPGIYPPSPLPSLPGFLPGVAAPPGLLPLPGIIPGLSALPSPPLSPVAPLLPPPLTAPLPGSLIPPLPPPLPLPLPAPLPAPLPGFPGLLPGAPLVPPLAG